MDVCQSVTQSGIMEFIDASNNASHNATNYAGDFVILQVIMQIIMQVKYYSSSYTKQPNLLQVHIFKLSASFTLQF